MRRFLHIEVLSQGMAVAVSGQLDAKTAIISITAPRQNLPKFAASHWLKGVFRLCFYDITEDYPGMPAPKSEDFRGLRAFVDRMQRKEVEFYIVHCAAGISRSSGLAAALGEYIGVDPHVFGNPAYFPNRLVYRLAREEFGLSEKMQDFNTRQNQAYLNDPKGTIRKVVRFAKRGRTVEEIARRIGISEELTDKIVRICLTYPDAAPDEILSRMGM